MTCHKFKLTNLLLCRKKIVRRVRRLNPISNTKAMLRLNPYAAVLKRQAILSGEKRKMAREEALAKKRGVSIILLRSYLFKFCHDDLLLVRVYEDS